MFPKQIHLSLTLGLTKISTQTTAQKFVRFRIELIRIQYLQAKSRIQLTRTSSTAWSTTTSIQRIRRVSIAPWRYRISLGPLVLQTSQITGSTIPRPSNKSSTITNLSTRRRLIQSLSTPNTTSTKANLQDQVK